MTGAVALAAIAAALAVSPDLLEQARSAFAAADYARAEALALEAAAPPNTAAALYLAGLARFRAGRPAEALEAIDRAGVEADAPAAFHHNRAACLFELGRYDEAEAESVKAAGEDPALAAVALVDAGFAALAQGAVDRARAHAERARAVASGPAVALVADLEGELAGAAAPAAIDPPAPERPRAPSPASRWGVVARAETGWDSNALQTGTSSAPLRPGAAAEAAASAVALTRVALSRRFALGARARGEAVLGLDQLAYADGAAQDRSVQLHGLSFRLEVDASDRARVGAAVEGQLAYAGLSDLRGMQALAGARLWSALDEGDRATTHLDLGFAWKSALASEFDYLSGDRLEAGLSQDLRLGPARLSAGLRAVRDEIGSAADAALFIPPSPLCPLGCTSQPVLPLGYDAAGAWLSARAALGARLSLELSVGGEWRRYLDDDVIVLARAEGALSAVALGRREERRVFTGEVATFRLTPRVSLLLRHELLVSRSTLPGDGGGGSGGGMGGVAGCRPADAACRLDSARSYDKQVFTVGGELAW